MFCRMPILLLYDIKWLLEPVKLQKHHESIIKSRLHNSSVFQIILCEKKKEIKIIICQNITAITLKSQ